MEKGDQYICGGWRRGMCFFQGEWGRRGVVGSRGVGKVFCGQVCVCVCVCVCGCVCVCCLLYISDVAYE